MVEGRIKVLPFDQMRDPTTGRTRVRTVDIDGDGYRVARKYMIRLEKRDLADPEMCGRLATEARMSPDDFVRRFQDVVELAGAQ